jgi:hypothetical protein
MFTVAAASCFGNWLQHRVPTGIVTLRAASFDGAMQLETRSQNTSTTPVHLYGVQLHYAAMQSGDGIHYHIVVIYQLVS